MTNVSKAQQFCNRKLYFRRDGPRLSPEFSALIRSGEIKRMCASYSIQVHAGEMWAPTYCLACRQLFGSVFLDDGEESLFELDIDRDTGALVAELTIPHDDCPGWKTEADREDQERDHPGDLVE